MIWVEGNIVYLEVNGHLYCYRNDRPPIGQGGMGCVYLGRRLDKNRRPLFPVAVKRVKPHIAANPAMRRRIMLEADLAFAHPNMVETLGMCETGGSGGAMFIVSKYVAGQNIDVYLNDNVPEGTNRAELAIRLIGEVADALDYIHSKGIVHLDIKPSNIMVENGRQARLMDLGIAYATGVSEKLHKGVTGTRGFASPEQYVSDEGASVEPDARADVYSLAATLYVLLSGKVPGASPDWNIPNVGKNLKKVLSKGLRHDREERPESAGKFARMAKDALRQDSHRGKYKWVGPLVAVSVAVISIIAVIGVIVSSN